jgi:hypothetical protein
VRLSLYVFLAYFDRFLLSKGKMLSLTKNKLHQKRYNQKDIASRYFLSNPALNCTVFKGTVSRDFRPMVFSSNNTPGPTDSWAKAVSNADSYSRNRILLLLDNRQLSIYLTAMR